MAGTAQVIHRGAVPIAAAILDTISKLVTDIDRFIANACLTAVGAAMATTTTKAKTVNSATYRINGALKSKAGTDNLWDLTGGTNVAAGNFQKYLLCLDAAGTATFVEGTQAATAAGVILPAAPASKSVVAVLTVQNGSGAAFIPGTTALNAASITSTFVDGYDSALMLGYALS